MLGPLELRRGGRPVALPASRKVRAVLAFLVLAPRAVSRGQLCEMLWDVPSDPRGELRWCLSKLRRLVDDPGVARLRSREDTVQLELRDCSVDALEIARASEGGIASLPLGEVRSLCALFEGDLLEGLEIDRSPAFGGWLVAQRRRFRAWEVALLEHLATLSAGGERFDSLARWLQLAPFDRRAHELLLRALAEDGRMREAEEHLATAAAQFEAEGLDFAPIRAAWRAARTPRTEDPRSSAPTSVAIDLSGGADDVVATAARRASIAVMPFADAGAAPGAYGGIADALAHDVISRLAKLRSLFVIAQGTVFALRDRHVGPEAAGRMLDVDYVVSGSVRFDAGRIAVMVELAETRTARIVWTEVYDHALDAAFLVLEGIGDRIVSCVASEIETIERNRAVLKPPSSLDAWEAHHRGLWHMYRFTKPDNEHAQHFFERAVRLDPTFARAYAGLSFTHWQNAFQGWAERERASDQAFAAAGQALLADDRDPGAHWAMGRALWLRGLNDQSVVELHQAVDLSPNFAQAHYTLAFVQSQAGDALGAISASDHSRELSPYDPLLFAMLAARAVALVRLGRFEEAAAWGVKAAARPNAHVHIFAIAAFSLALAGSLDAARVHAAAIRRMAPGYTAEDFTRAFRFDAQGEALFRRGAHSIGMG